MRILIVEDSHQTRQLLLYLLQQRFMQEAKFREATDLKTAISYLRMWKEADRQSRVDKKDVDPICVILDLSLPDSAGKETFVKLFKAFPDLPIVVMTNTNDRQLAEEMVDIGAQDYILKNFTDEEEIFRRISFAIRRHRRTVSLPPPDAESIHILESNKAAMLTAHESGEHIVMAARSADLLSGMTELIKKTFVGVQGVNLKQEKLSLSQEYASEQVKILKDEVLGTNGRRSMRSEIEILNIQQKELGSDVGELKDRINSIELDKKEDARSKHSAKIHIATHKLDNRTKLIIAFIGLIGMIITVYLTHVFGIQLRP